MTFFTIPELAALLKFSETHVRGLIHSGVLKCHRMTTGTQGGIRVSQQQLDEYLKATESAAGASVPPPPRPRLRLKHLD